MTPTQVPLLGRLPALLACRRWKGTGCYYAGLNWQHHRYLSCIVQRSALGCVACVGGGNGGGAGSSKPGKRDGGSCTSMKVQQALQSFFPTCPDDSASRLGMDGTRTYASGVKRTRFPSCSLSSLQTDGGPGRRPGTGLAGIKQDKPE